MQILSIGSDINNFIRYLNSLKSYNVTNDAAQHLKLQIPNKVWLNAQWNLMDEYIPLGDTLYVFRISKYISYLWRN